MGRPRARIARLSESFLQAVRKHPIKVESFPMTFDSEGELAVVLTYKTTIFLQKIAEQYGISPNSLFTRFEE